MSEPDKQQTFGARLVGGSAVFAVATLVSRAGGLLREAIVARHFALSRQRDVYAMVHGVVFEAVTVVNRLVNGALVPVVSHLLEQGRPRAATAVVRLAAAVVLGCLAALAIVLALPAGVIGGRVFGLAGSELRDFAAISRILAWYAPLVGAMTVLWGALLARQRFVGPALAQAVPNLALVAVLVWLVNSLGITALAWATLAGGLAFALVTAGAAARAGQPQTPDAEPWQRAAARLGLLSLPLLAQAVVAAVAAVAERAILLRRLTGTLSAFEYGGYAVSAVSGALLAGPLTVAAAVLAREGGRGDIANLTRRAEQVLRFMNLLSIAAMCFLAVFAWPTVTVLYRGGRFAAEDTARTTYMLRLRSITPTAQAASEVMSRTFHAQQDTLTPTVVWTGTALVRLALLAAGAGLGGGAEMVVGLRVAALIANVALLGWLLRRRDGRMSWSGILAAAAWYAVLLLAAALVARQVSQLVAPHGALAVLVAGAGSFTVLGLGAAVTGSTERRLLSAALRELKRVAGRGT